MEFDRVTSLCDVIPVLLSVLCQSLSLDVSFLSVESLELTEWLLCRFGVKGKIDMTVEVEVRILFTNTMDVVTVLLLIN